MDFAALKKTGVTQTEFAAIAGVSRVTVSNWTRNEAEVHDARKPKIARLLDILSKAHADGKLPLPQPTPRANRLLEIKKVIASYLKAGT